MAERRMFSKKITESDAFLSLPLSSQCLYFHLSLNADDDGFVNSPKKVMKMIGASEDDANLLLSRRFIIAFDTGVIVIKHWRMNNYLRSDRYKPTDYTDEMQMLTVKENGSYSRKDELVYHPSTTGTRSIDKDSKEKVSKDKPQKRAYGEFEHVLLTDDEMVKLENKYGYASVQDCIRYLDWYIHEKSYKSKSHYIAIQRWVYDAVAKEKANRSKEIVREEIVPVYDSSANPQVDEERLKELMERRKKCQ